MICHELVERILWAAWIVPIIGSVALLGKSLQVVESVYTLLVKNLIGFNESSVLDILFLWQQIGVILLVIIILVHDIGVVYLLGYLVPEFGLRNCCAE